MDPLGMCRPPHLHGLHRESKPEINFVFYLCTHYNYVQDLEVWEEKVVTDVGQISSYFTGRSSNNKECGLI